MNAFDDHILNFFNRLAQKSTPFDHGVVLLGNASLLKGGILMALVWWVWFGGGEEGAVRRRSILLSGLAASFAAIIVSRSLAKLLPFRERPRHTAGFDFVSPSGAGDMDLSDLSSFPSDHAVLFFTLATALWFARRSFGVFAYAYVAIAICLPRLYLGLHWPTDIVAGAVLGIGVGWLGARDRVVQLIGTPVLAWQERKPGPFYAAMFVVGLEVATLFDDARSIAGWTIDVLGAV